MNISKCYNCERPLVPVGDSPQRRRNDQPTFQNALHINLSGDYGEYIDGHKDIVLCSICAEQFVREVSWAKLALEFVT